jgi:hypothetical protein
VAKGCTATRKPERSLRLEGRKLWMGPSISVTDNFFARILPLRSDHCLRMAGIFPP